MNSNPNYLRIAATLAVFLLFSYDNFMAADTKKSEAEESTANFKAATETIWEWIQYKKVADTILSNAEIKIKALDATSTNPDVLNLIALTKKLETLKTQLKTRDFEFIQEMKVFSVSSAGKNYAFETKFSAAMLHLNTELNEIARSNTVILHQKK